MSSAPLAPQALNNYANQIRRDPRNAEIVAKAIQQAGENDNALANQLQDAGFTFSHAGQLYYLGPPLEIREIVSRFHYQDPPDAFRIGAAGTGIPFLGEIMRLVNTTGGSLTLTHTPTVATPNPSIAGRLPIVRLLNVGTQNLVLQDRGTLAGSGLALGAATRTIAPRQTLVLMYSNDLSLWVEQNYAAVL